MAFSEFRFYSPLTDQEMIRVSMSNERSNGFYGEFFTIIPASDGRRYRERRDEALNLIMTAIESGLEPGEVLPA